MKLKVMLSENRPNYFGTQNRTKSNIHINLYKIFTKEVDIYADAAVNVQKFPPEGRRNDCTVRGSDRGRTKRVGQ